MAQPSWALGDSDYNGFVDDDDVTLLGVFYNPGAAPLNPPAEPGARGDLAPSAVAAVPEPATVVLVGVMAAAIAAAVGVRRRKGVNEISKCK